MVISLFDFKAIGKNLIKLLIRFICKLVLFFLIALFFPNSHSSLLNTDVVAETEEEPDLTTKTTASAPVAQITTQSESVTEIESIPMIHLPQTGQTPTLPILTRVGLDGYTHTGVAWAYVESGPRGTLLNPAIRFVLSAGAESECISDNLTGLTWLKSPESATYTWLEAQNYANNLTACGVVRGKWRLPTVNELFSLVNYSGNPSQYLNNNGFSYITPSKYWTSTVYVAQPGEVNAWIIDMNNTNVNTEIKLTSHNYVLTVLDNVVTTAPAQIARTDERDLFGVVWPTHRFVVGGGVESNCVTDKLTGLTWVRDLSTVNNGLSAKWYDIESASLPDILAAFNSSGANCGFTDWRIPNIVELKSLVNYTQFPNSGFLNNNGFIHVPSKTFWSSTVSTVDSTKAMTLYMGSGVVSSSAAATSRAFIWPVHGGQ